MIWQDTNSTEGHATFKLSVKLHVAWKTETSQSYNIITQRHNPEHDLLIFNFIKARLGFYHLVHILTSCIFKICFNIILC
jgi:hypothetical protein